LVNSDLIKYFGENIGRLEPFDYFLILVFIALVSAGLYYVIRSIYRQVIAAQNDLISLKEKTIKHQERTILSLTTEKNDLQEKYEQIEKDLEKIRNDLNLKNGERDKKVNALVKHYGNAMRMLVLARIASLNLNILHSWRRMAIAFISASPIYKKQGMRDPVDVVRSIDKLTTELLDKLEIIDFKDENNGEIRLVGHVPDDFFHYMTVESEKLRAPIGKEIDRMEIIFNELYEFVEKNYGSKKHLVE
jgi:hypothetical protein